MGGCPKPSRTSSDAATVPLASFAQGQAVAAIQCCPKPKLGALLLLLLLLLLVVVVVLVVVMALVGVDVAEAAAI
jgi:hypothetical protein